jgi:hypothetical protein
MTTIEYSTFTHGRPERSTDMARFGLLLPSRRNPSLLG